MPAILNLAQELLSLARSCVEEHQLTDARKVLSKLLGVPDLSPSVAAEANYLMAKIHFERAGYAEARENLLEALMHDPDDPESHFLLARANELDEAGSMEAAFRHYDRAARLDRNDGRKQSAYALSLARCKDQTRGMRLLEKAYAQHRADPVVVENYAIGLLEADQWEKAKQVVVRASAENEGDRDFHELERRIEDWLREERRLSQSKSEPEAPPVVRFPGQSKKPRGQKRPPPGPQPSPEPVPAGEADSSLPPPIDLEGEAPLAEILQRMGPKYVAHLYDKLGLLGAKRADRQRSQIVAALLQRAFLNSMVKRLPADSRKLLRSLVRVGGCAPAAILFQNTGPDAPPPDYVQPLVWLGLLYLAHTQRNPRGPSVLVAAIPFDLVERLADVLHVEVGE